MLADCSKPTSRVDCCKAQLCHNPLGLTWVCLDTLVVELSGGDVGLRPVVGLKVFDVEGSALYVD